MSRKDKQARHPNEVYRTKTGKIITEAMIDAWVAEAEAGYDVSNLQVPPPPEVAVLYGSSEVITGLPDQLKPGSYQVMFEGMEYHPGSKPVLRFAFVGPAPQQQVPLTEPPPELPDWAKPGPELTEHEHEVLEGQMRVTREQAEARLTELQRQQPDLYQVSQVETLNVSKLARVIMRLITKDVLDEADLGLPGDIGWTDIESWLRT